MDFNNGLIGINMSEYELIKSLNSYVGTAPSIDNAIYYLSDFNPLKMLPLVIIICWLWFSKYTARCSNNRENIIRGVLGSFFAMFTARILSKILPFRLRPLYEPSLSLNIPDIMPPYHLDGWSSMPSDNATLGFALATTIILIHLKWGIFAYLHVIFLICFPRIYLSLHYPSDILAGAFLGVGMSYASFKFKLLDPFVRTVFLIKDRLPKCFYLFAIALAVEFATMFKVLRALLNLAKNVF